METDSWHRTSAKRLRERGMTAVAELADVWINPSENAAIRSANLIRATLISPRGCPKVMIRSGAS